MLNWEGCGNNNKPYPHVPWKAFFLLIKGGVDEEDMGVQLCVLSVVVSVCSQPAQAVAGKETVAGVKAVGTCVNDGGINKKCTSDRYYETHFISMSGILHKLHYFVCPS